MGKDKPFNSPLVWGLIGLGAFLLLAGGTTVALMVWGSTRGWKLNNPGNLEKTPDGSQPWQGEFVPSSDVRFAQFDTVENGLRAMAINALHYFTKHNISTLREFGERWAPQMDKNPANYGARLAEIVGVDPDVPFDYVPGLSDLIHAIIINEEGSDPLPNEYLEIAENVAETRDGIV